MIRAWLSDLKRDPNPILESYEIFARKLRDIAFEDFAELLQITKPLRERYDDRHSNDT